MATTDPAEEQQTGNHEHMMNRDSDYLAEYRNFYEKFANIGESSDQLPVKVVGCLVVTEVEIPGEILSYTLQYLDSIECPPGLVPHICREVLEDTRKTLQLETTNITSLTLMRAAVSSVHHCLQAGLDNEKACRLSKPPEAPRSTASASRNGHRCMEDRHIALDDLSRIVDSQTSEHSSFYAVYDGHSGPLAAAYSAAQLHMCFVNSEYYKVNPLYALKEAFLKTDMQFGTKKSMGGSTAVVCYLKGKDLLVGWAGDSQALLVGDGSLIQLVNPHKPSREDENNRIVRLGGQVLFNGIWRVNGILAVSRAIGDTLMKPYVISEPEFASVKLGGFEEFLVLASDGLWDYVSEDEVALEVYKGIEKHSGDIKKISDQLVRVAKAKGSTDNISVIVVFLQDINKLAEKAKWLLEKFATMDASFDNTSGAQTNRFHVSSNQDNPFAKEGLAFDLDTGFKKQNGDDTEPDVDPFPRPTNGKNASNHFSDEMDEEDDDEDLGPETDVDAVDDIVMSPSLAAARALSQGSGSGCNQVMDMLDGIGAQRQETPTPPVDAEADRDYGGSALVENVGDSGGEESDEDEWNYFQGDKKDSKGDCIEDPSLLPAEENQDILKETISDNREETMSSPLNPEAPPFVPVSPTGSMEGSHLPQRLLSEEVVAQSPQKPVPMDDIKVPEPREFEDEISHRLGDLGNDEFHNGHSDNSAMSSQENLKEALQGNEKQLTGLSLSEADQLDMQFGVSDSVVNQAEFDRVQKDTTDLCDIQVTYNQQANPSYDDEGIDEELYERLKNKERDPMSMSFYQEKDLDTCEEGHNPFDLNAVQMIPNDIDEFCNDKPQAEILTDNETLNPFLDNMQSSDVFQHEIHAAISDLDNAVTNESDSMDSIVKAPSPMIFEKANMELPEVKELNSPISDNVSQMTETSEQEHLEHQDLLNVEEEQTAVSHDSAYSADAPSPVASPIEADIDICSNNQIDSNDQICEDILVSETNVQLEQPLQAEQVDVFSCSPVNDNVTHDQFSQLDDFMSQPVVEPHIEQAAQFIEPLKEQMDFMQDFASPIPQAESLTQNAEIDITLNKEQNIGYHNDHHEDIHSDIARSPEPALIGSESIEIASEHNDLETMQAAPKISESFEFSKDFIEDNDVIETSQTNTETVENIICEQKIDNVESINSQLSEAIEKVPEIVQQVEESKIVPESAVTKEDTESTVISAAVGAVAGAALVAAAIEPVCDKKALVTKTAPKTSTTTKKAPAAKPLSSPSKTTVSKTSVSSTATKKPASAPAKPISASKTTISATPKPAPAKPKTAAPSTTKAPVPKSATTALKSTTSATPKPRTSIAAKTTASVDKKPLANGDVKKEPIKKTAPLSKPAAPKPSVPKTNAVPAKTSPTSPKPAGLTSAAPKAPISKAPASRPVTAPAAPKPKPAPITRAPLSKPASAAAKTSTVDKSVKETTNKQLSARPTPAPRSVLAPKPDSKVTSKVASKTTMTTTCKPMPTKRPISATTKTTTAKTNGKNSTITVKTTTVTSEKLNGSIEKCEVEIRESQQIILNGTDIPLKDDSPQQVDNSLLPIIDAAAD